MNKAIRNAVLTAAIAGAQSAAASDKIAIDPSAVDAVAQRVTKEVAPAIEHLTNNEAWYQSRVTWGVLVAAVATVIKPITGEFLDPGQTLDVVASLASAGQLYGFGLTLYGRWKARKPIAA